MKLIYYAEVLTNEVEVHSGATLIRPSVVVAERVWVPVWYPQPGVKHPGVDVVSCLYLSASEERQQ